MNLIKTIFAVSLIGLCVPLCAQPIKIKCTDKKIEYDDQALKKLTSEKIEARIIQNSVWNGSGFVLRNNAIIKLPIDSKGLEFMVALASKDDAQAFAFIDSLDEQTFRLVSFYTQVLKEHRISDLLKYKMIKNPKLQQLAEMPNRIMKNFVGNRYQSWNQNQQRSDTLAEKYLGKEIDNRNFQNYIHNNATTDSIFPALILIDFYQETMKKPLPLNTDHLNEIFNAQPYDIQQAWLNKNLVTVS